MVLDEAPSVSNFRYSADSIVFFYNPYEVGPYSEGAQEVSLSWEDLKNHLKPNRLP
jgi:hypothetical protein